MANQQKRRRRKKRRATMWITWIVILIALGCVGYVGAYFYLPSFDTQDFHTYFELDPNTVTLFVRDARQDAIHPIEKNGMVYFPFAFVKEFVDSSLFWDESSQILTVTTRDKVLRMKPDADTYSQNGQPMALSSPILLINEKVQLPMDFLSSFYPITVSYHPEKKIVTMDYPEEGREVALVVANTGYLRYKPDPKSIIEEKLALGAEVTVYKSEEQFVRVRAENGLVGFISKKEILNLSPEPPSEQKKEVSFPPRKPVNGKVNLVFDQVISAEDNAKPERRQAVKGLNVLAPTWFSFDIATLNGDIVSIADKEYVDWAHGNGYQVWPLLSDFSSDASVVLNSSVNHTALVRTEIRDHVITQIMDLIARFDLDGINIDYEYLQLDDADCYAQFFRELGVYMRLRGKTLSVDMYNQDATNWSFYYNRASVGQDVDYVIVMAYDEHTNGGTSGPVASLGFVDNGIAKALEEIPKEKILLGLPYYVRVWREESEGGDIKTTLRNYDMSTGYSQFASHGVEWSWDAGIGASYAEYSTQENGSPVTYKVWLEDERSIEEKLKILQKYDLPGVAGWKRGLEKSEIWGLLNQYFKIK